MQAKDIRGRSQKCPAKVGYSKLRLLDDMLQRERKRRHVMSKSEFRNKMLRRDRNGKREENQANG